jgi:SNF2 family DNA or RNA helicase
MMRQATGCAKAPWVAAFIEMIAEQEIPVVVFAWSRAVYDILNSHLAKFNPVMYTGTESKIQKNASLEKFVKGESMVFLMSMASGEGLDGLQKRCCTTVHAEFPWTPAVVEQNIGRLHRDGQTEPVTSYFCVSDFGLDPAMVEALDLKKAQLDGLIGEQQLGTVKKFDSQAYIR